MAAVSDVVTSEAPSHAAPTEWSAPPVTQRIDVLDVLRGIALIGMYVVHFTDASVTPPAGSVGATVIHGMVALFFSERFWALFAILFGVGFAIGLSKAEARGDNFVPRYLRRIAGLLAFGLVAEIAFGYHVLVEYALWALPLLLIRRWPVRRLVVLLVVCAMSLSVFFVARAAVGINRLGEDGWRQAMEKRAAVVQAQNKDINAMKESASYPTVVEGRLRRMPWFYSQPFMYLPANDFTLFLLGVIAFRVGVFQRPEQHRGLIIAMTLFGFMAWAAATFALPAIVGGGAPRPDKPMLAVIAHAGLRSVFGLVRTMWLAFTYIGIVLLLVARDPDWIKRLAALGWTGRMALTNYMLQVIVLDLTFSNYALGFEISPVVAVLSAVALFAAQAFASRWWLSRYRYGPLEWLWRSITYLKRQPMRAVLPTPSPHTAGA